MKNQLRHLKEFKDILSNYKISSSSKQLLNQVNLLLLVSPTAVGRNTIINELVKSGNYHYVISDTTRKPRINNNIQEINGVEYWFKTEDEFLENIKNGSYIEAAVIHDQQVSGISTSEIEKAIVENKTAVKDIEVQGADKIISAKPDTYVVFILPPSFGAWMSRLDSRGFMPIDEKIRRLRSALSEFDSSLKSKYYIFLINDELSTVIEKLNHITKSQGVNLDDQEEGKKLAERLIRDTTKYLKKLTGTLD